MPPKGIQLGITIVPGDNWSWDAVVRWKPKKTYGVGVEGGYPLVSQAIFPHSAFTQVWGACEQGKQIYFEQFEYNKLSNLTDAIGKSIEIEKGGPQEMYRARSFLGKNILWLYDNGVIV